MVTIYFRGLLGFVFLALPLLAQTSSAPEAIPSPAETDLICSTINSSDCYPRVLVPTKDFQIIREGQDIPPGLHVRLNIYTGEREARLNIPMEGEEGASLEAILDLPTEQAIITVEQPSPEAEAGTPHIPLNAPVYDTAGKIPPPPPSSGDEMSIFQKALLVTKMEARDFDTALDDLKELSHDIYYGLEITKDGPVIEKLTCLMLGSGSQKMPALENGRDRKAASILANSIQNNPTALAELGKAWKSIMYPLCPLEKAPGTSNFVSILRNRLDSQDPATLKAKITAISGLLRNPQIRDNFLANGGMELLLQIILEEGKEWDATRMKVGQLVMDNFLDEHMGAVQGLFPKRPETEKQVCQSDKKRMLEDGCWEAHVEGLLKGDKDADEWVREFLGQLREKRRRWGSSIKDREL